MVDSLKIIRPFKDLDYDISTILNFKYIHYRFGRIEKQYLQKFEKYIYDNLDTLFIKCGEDEQYVYGVYFVPEHEAHKVHAVYSSMHFERIFVPDDYQGTAVPQRLFLQKQPWNPVPETSISVSLPPARRVKPILSIYSAAG